MKTTLPNRSLIVKKRLDAIVKEILAVGKDKIAMIILFGSYARGDWVQEDYEPGTMGTGYQSDFDILVIMKQKKYTDRKANELSTQINRRLRERLPVDILKEPYVTLIIEPIKRVNEQVEKGRYFFSDIKKEGVLLYDTGEYQIAEARELSREEIKQIAQDDYEGWFESGFEFLPAVHFFMSREQWNKAAFLLHQATENFYNAIELVFAAYKSRTHDIEKLNEKVAVYHPDLSKIFPVDIPEREECFKLLKAAYIRARYDKHYKITKEQLLYLIDRVEELKKLTEKICLERINKI